MGKLIATTQLTVDGVIDSVGEWVDPGGDHGQHSFELQKKSAGLVMGRKTYEGLAGYWPNQPDDEPWAAMVNPMPQVRGLDHARGAAGVERDPDRGRPRRGRDEAQGGGRRDDLFVQGNGEFAYALVRGRAGGRVPVLRQPAHLGRGACTCSATAGPIRMELADVKRFDSGVVGLTYTPAS